jgi:hypothetical protein
MVRQDGHARLQGFLPPAFFVTLTGIPCCGPGGSFHCTIRGLAIPTSSNGLAGEPRPCLHRCVLERPQHPDRIPHASLVQQVPAIGMWRAAQRVARDGTPEQPGPLAASPKAEGKFCSPRLQRNVLPARRRNELQTPQFHGTPQSLGAASSLDGNAKETDGCASKLPQETSQKIRTHRRHTRCLITHITNTSQEG